MFSRRLLVFALTFLLTSLVFVIEAWAEPRAKIPWEVTVIFLSSADDDTVYQTDIDANLVELANVLPSQDLKITIARLWPNRSYVFQPDPQASTSAPYQALFESPRPIDIQIPGVFTEEKRAEAPADFVSKALKLGFSSENNRRLLVIQTHGFGPKGIKQLKTLELKKILEGITPRAQGKLTDILWMDSCFMGSLEFAVEMKNLSDYLISSEDSEFSAGAPFDALSAVAEEDLAPLEMATALAQMYIGSYSYKISGTQRRSVFSSAATVSLIETSKLDQLTKLSKQLSRDIKNLSDANITKLNRSLKTVQMELNHLVDFGRLAQKLRTSVGIESAVPVLKLLEVLTPAKLNSNYRVKVVSETPGSQLVFGYDEFTKGFEGDVDTLEKLPKNLKPVGFVPGPNGKSWPYRLINKLLYLTPFSPGTNSFSFYLQNENQKTEVTTVRRLKDFVMRTRVSENNPIIFVGATQGVGNAAEKYTGLGVLNPLLPKPDLDYMKLEFPKETSWGR